MQVDVSFQKSKVYNIPEPARIDVVLAEVFSLFTDSATPVQWASINDATLKIKEGPISAELEATALGTSTILIMDADLKTLRKIVINVVAEILEPAVNLNATGDEPVPKVQ